LALPQFRSLFLFRALFIVLVGLAALYLSLRPTKPHLRVGAPLGILLAWLVWLLISLLWSADLQGGLRYLTFFVMMSVLVVTVVLVASNRRRLGVAVALLAIAYLAAIGIGLLEALTFHHLPTSTLRGAPRRFQWLVSSVFHNPNDFATYISLWFPLWLGTFLFFRHPLLLTTSAGVIALSLFELTRTQSTLNAVALVLSTGALVVVGSLRTLLDGSFPWRMLALGAGVVALALFCAVVFFPSWAQEALSTLATAAEQSVLGGLIDVESKLMQITTGIGSGANRVALIESGWKAVQGYHLLGVGAGNAEYHMLFFPETGRVQNLHNWWMEVFVNGGLIAFGLYLAFYGFLLWGLLKAALTSSDRPLAYLGVALLASLVGFAVGCAGPSSVIHFTPMWIHFGLALAVINVYQNERDTSVPS
ncbi:MAG TPA: hypothetical protein EYP49_14625, partial [Anaerolineae bacterium]|nr:hypothetical protein [Anaerolineae bacterium]